MTAFGAPVLFAQPQVNFRELVKYFCNTDLVYAATREVELAIWRRDHLASTFEPLSFRHFCHCSST